MRDVLLVIVFSYGALLSLKRPWIAVMLWTWLSVMNPHMMAYGFARAVPFAYISALLALFGLLVSRERQSPFIGAPVKWMTAFIVWMTLSWLLGKGVASGLETAEFDKEYDLWLRATKGFLMIYVTMALLINRHQIMAFIVVAIGSLGVLGAKGGLFSIAKGFSFHAMGPEGSMIEDNNHFGLAMIMAVPLLCFLYRQMGRSGYKRIAWCFLVMAGLCVLSAVGSQSRGAFAALVVLLLVMWWRSKHKLVSALALVVLVPAVYFALPTKLKERVSTIQTAVNMDESGNDSFWGRVRAWNVGLHVAMARPTGAGMHFEYAEFFTKYDLWAECGTDNVLGCRRGAQGKVRAAHSIFFQVLGNHGFIGLFIYLMIGVTTFRTAGWLRKKAKLIPEAAWAADLGDSVQITMAAFAVGAAALSVAFYDVQFDMMAMVLLVRHWVETKGWERDPKMPFMDYCLRGIPRYQKTAANAFGQG